MSGIERSSRIEIRLPARPRGRSPPPRRPPAPTTSKPFCFSRAASASRVSGWSSTMRIRSVMRLRRILPIDRGDAGGPLGRLSLGPGAPRSALLGAALGALPDLSGAANPLPAARAEARPGRPSSCSRAASWPLLSATRFAVEGRRFDLFLCCGFFVTSVSWLSFSIVPAIAETSSGPHRALGGRRSDGCSAGALIAMAPFARGRVQHRRFVLGNALAVCVARPDRHLGHDAVARLRPARPRSRPRRASMPLSLTGALAAAALLHLLSVIGFGNRFRTQGRGPRLLARARRDADALLVAALHLHAARARRRRLAGRLPATARLRRAARRRLAGDPQLRVRPGRRRGACPRGTRDPRRPRAVPLRRLDARRRCSRREPTRRRRSRGSRRRRCSPSRRRATRSSRSRRHRGARRSTPRCAATSTC